MSHLGDRRRNLGPTDFDAFYPLEKQQQKLELTDGLRPVYLSQSVVRNASGSAYIEIGDTRIEACVYGPQPRRGEFEQQSNITVNVRIQPFALIPSSENVERMTEDFVRSSLIRAILLDQYPKSDISVLINVLSGPQTTSTLMAAALNATSMAVVSAGIALHDLLAAGAVAWVDGKVYADVDVPNTDKQLVAAYQTSSDQLVAIEVLSNEGIPRQELKAMLDKSLDTAKTMKTVMESYLLESYAGES